MEKKMILSGIVVFIIVAITAVVVTTKGRKDVEVATPTISTTTVITDNNYIIEGGGAGKFSTEDNSEDDYNYSSAELCSANETTRITSEPMNAVVDVGATVEFPCAGGNLGHCTIFWLKGNHYVVSNDLVLARDQRISVTMDGMRGGTLNIQHVKASDVGDYTCKVHKGHHVVAQITHTLKIN